MLLFKEVLFCDGNVLGNVVLKFNEEFFLVIVDVWLVIVKLKIGMY